MPRDKKKNYLKNAPNIKFSLVALKIKENKSIKTSHW